METYNLLNVYSLHAITKYDVVLFVPDKVNPVIYDRALPVDLNIKKLKEFLNTKNITISDERLCRLISDTKNNLYDMIDTLKKIIKNGYVGL